MLNATDRSKFIDYLEGQIRSNLEIMKPLEDMNKADPMLHKLKIECMAMEVVSKMLRSIYDEEI